MSQWGRCVQRGANAQAVTYTHRQTIRSEWLACRQLLDELIAVLRAFEFIEEDIFGIATSVWEVLEHAAKDGNGYAATHDISVESCIRPDIVRIRITDASFKSECTSKPTSVENLYLSFGPGLLMMRHLMTGIRFSDGGRTVDMWKEPTQHCVSPTLLRGDGTC